MGTSHPESRPWSIEKILSVNPKYILDVGAGSGTYFDALRSAGYQGGLEAVEVWEPYINEFHLEDKYDIVYSMDIRSKNFLNAMEDSFDVVIFGDILEHMSKEDALELWAALPKITNYALIAIPIIHYHQGEINGNPYEVHVKDDWSHEEVLESFSNIVDSWQGEIVGAYWADFTKDGIINS